MNESQKVVLLIGAFFAVAMGLVPPWSYTFQSERIDQAKPGGYALILTPPQPEDPENVRFGVRLDSNRLVIQWIVLAIATAVGLAVLHEKGSIQPRDAGTGSAQAHDT